MFRRGDTALPNEYRIAETETFQKQITNPEFHKIYIKIRSYVYPLLKRNPFHGNNIKKLKGDFAGVYRYRIGDYRLFYTIDTARIIVFVVSISHRKNAYKK